MDVDPDTLLEWLQTGHSDVRDMQLIALEQLCQILLLSDNIDHCFERFTGPVLDSRLICLNILSYPPRTFLPALCKIFLDENAPDNVLEATARSLTYYLDVSQECTRRIVSVDGTIKAICSRLLVIEVDNKISKDLAEQCIKTLELICARESSAVYEANGLTCILTFILDYGKLIFKDSLYSAISVIARLCTKIELNDSEGLEFCIESLSKLLIIYAADTFIIDNLLRCFASLTDRFIRKSIEPTQLAKYNLTNILISMLNENISQQQQSVNQHLQQQQQQQSPQQQQDLGNYNSAPNNSNTVSLSTIISLLSTLCRNSMQITNELFKSNILDLIEKAMLHGDERCVLDIMRLLDVLLVLLFEERDISTKTPEQLQNASNNNVAAHSQSKATKRTDSTIDKYHRQLIELIRNKDTDAFIDLLDTNQIDINYMDDVGQTLLNWASAFGTAEMVEYLCKKNADVNRGQRSSSLHYAACFGRSQIVKILLNHGANPDLRDEDGKMALDKARERTEEGHRDVVQILQSSNEYLIKSPLHSHQQKYSLTDECDEKSEKFKLNKLIDDCESVADAFIRRLIPTFCNFYMNCMLQNINRCTLNILRKLIFYSNKTQVEAILNKRNNLIVELLSKLLQETFNHDLVLIGLNISLDLLVKCQHLILEEFNRYGVSNRIFELTCEFNSGPNPTTTSNNYIEADTIELDRIYVWNSNWFILYTKDLIYVWNGFFILELSHNSNGWFRFLINSNLYSMYSNGQPELCSNLESNSCQTFIEKFNKSKEHVLLGQTDANHDKFRSIFKTKFTHQIPIENWLLSLDISSTEDEVDGASELCISNIYANQKTILNKYFKNGFQFESNRQEKLKFVSDEKLRCTGDLTVKNGDECTHGDNNTANKETKVKEEDLLKKQIYDLACKINSTFISTTNSLNKNDLGSKLNSIINDIYMSTDDTFESMLNAFKEFLVTNNDYISSYELSISDTVNLLMFILNNQRSQSSSGNIDKQHLFMKIFDDDRNALKILVHKLVLLLESIERLPLYLYDAPHTYNLQVFSKRFKLVLNCGGCGDDALDNSNKNVLNFTGRVLKVEPLANVSHLEKYLSKMVAKHWFDFGRADLSYLNQIKDVVTKGGTIDFKYENDFDTNGLIYWMGTNARQYDCWINPCTYNLVMVNSSDGKQMPCGQLSDILSHNSIVNLYTSDDENAWFCIDLGLFIRPTHYSLRVSKGFNSSTSSCAPRNWSLQMSNNGCDWYVLRSHVNDNSLLDAGSTATWAIADSAKPDQQSSSWRFVRLQQHGRNSSGKNSHFCISGFEIYGSIVDLPVYSNLECIKIKTDENSKIPNATENSGSIVLSQPKLLNRQRLTQTGKSNLQRQMVPGTRVQRGIDWKWNNQDDGCDSEGTIIGDLNNGWIECIWDNGTFNYYRMGAENKYDLRVTTSSSYDQTKLKEYNENALKKLTVTMLNLNLNKKQIQFNNSNTNSKRHSTLGRLFTEQLKKNNKNLNRILNEIENKGDKPNEVISKFNKKFSSTPTLSTKADKTINDKEKQQQILQQLGNQQLTQQQNHESDSALLTTTNSEFINTTNKLEQQQQQLKHHTLSLDTSLNANSSIEHKQLETTMEEDNHDDGGDELNDEDDEDNNAKYNDDELNDSTPSLNSTKTIANGNSNSTKINKLLATCLSSLNSDDVDLKSLLYQINLWNVVNNNRDPDLDNSFPSKPQSNNKNAEQKVCINNFDGSDASKANTKESDQHAASSHLSSLLQEIDDDDLANEDDAICENDNDANTTTDDADDYMDDDMLNEYERLQKQLSQHSQQQLSCTVSRSNITNEHMLRIRDLKRRHSQQQQQQQQQAQTQHQDEFVLKCQFSALIPAFDPRPGKVNVNQIQDIQVPPQQQVQQQSKPDDLNSSIGQGGQHLTSTIPFIPKIDLYLRVNKQAVSSTGNPIEFYEDEIKLTNKNATIFQYIQQLLTNGSSCAKNFSVSTLKYEKMKAIWDTTYTLVYREAKQSQSDANENDDRLKEIFAVQPNKKNSLTDILRVLSILKDLSHKQTSLAAEEFYSKKLNNKLIQQLQDSLVLASRSMPDWCMHLLHSYKFLFPFDTRQLYFQTTAFGVSRSIVWLQTKREQLMANIRGPSSQRRTNNDEHLNTHEYRIGRLKHERVKIPREPSSLMLEHALNTLKFHATRKAILEFEFSDEEGTGLGPTLEFYSLIAAEVQRKVHSLWYCDCDDTNESQFFHARNGLFPIAFDANQCDSKKFESVLDLFHFLGIFIAKSLQDQRLVDIPLSLPFLKILCCYKESANTATMVNSIDGPGGNQLCPIDSSPTIDELKRNELKIKNNLCEILNLDDLELIDVHRANLLKQLKCLIKRKEAINADADLTNEEKLAKIVNQKLDLNGTQVDIADLALVFQYSSPSAQIFGYDTIDLIDNGSNIFVDSENFDDYYDLMTRLIFKRGIEKQIKAFKIGFDSVFPMESLKCFTPYELKILLSGEQAPKWTRDDIINYTEPKLGYTRESPGFQRFVNVMCSMNADERKLFVQFLTGCSSLPPGGLANLTPHLTVVKKDGCDSNYPSVNTCVHYLKLPEYSSEEILKEKLSIACREKGFYLN